MEKPEDILASVEYEHNRKGCVVSRGKTTIDKDGLVHSIQYDREGHKIAEAIFTPSGELISNKIFDRNSFFKKLFLFWK